jgi:glutathione peroxidase
MKVILTTILFCVTLCAHAQVNESSIYDIIVHDGDGKEVLIKDYKGKVMLIVNTATHCGFTPQYNELEALYEKYHKQGLEILDFPCNQFGEQAPGSNEEIHSFCTSNFSIMFSQFGKVDVNGSEASPLFTYLKSEQGFGGFDQSDQRGKIMHEMLLKQDKDYAKKSDIKWNFTKFLVDRNGNVVKRFEPTDKMEDVDKAILDLLNKHCTR